MGKPTKRSDEAPAIAHPFHETNDAGLSAFASGGSGFSGSEANMLAVTTGFLRATRCALPGCGKPRQDPIHAAAED
jgi:hypothetical protein